MEKDDITDSSVILAGPGNLQMRSTKLTTVLQVGYPESPRDSVITCMSYFSNLDNQEKV